MSILHHSKFLKDLNNRGHIIDVFYDIGANIGRWSLEAQKVFPKARFELFEPLADRLTDSKINEITQCSMHSVALSDLNGDCEIKVLDNNCVGSSILISDLDRKKNLSIIPCECRKLDDLVCEKKLPQPNFMKLDTQASELKVLKGAVETLKQTNFLLIETWIRRVYGPETPLFHELCSWLYDRDFVIYEILSLEDGRDDDGVLRWFDAVFINKSASKFPKWML